MNNDKSLVPDLDQLEKRTFKTIFEDGLLDINIGSIYLGMTFMWTFEFELWIIGMAIYFCIAASSMTFMLFAKKYITKPRMGSVKFSNKRKKKQLKVKLFLLLMVVINLIVLFLTYSGFLGIIITSADLFFLLAGMAFITLPFSVLAYTLDNSRMYIIGLMGGLSLFFAFVLNPIFGDFFSAFFSFGISGIIIIVWGLCSLIRFIKKYPIVKNKLELKENEGGE